MKLQQLRCLQAVVRHGLNTSTAAQALYTSQSGVSKQIRLLEQELGVELLVRNGKRIVALTEPGRALLAVAERILQEVDNARRIGEEFRNERSGSLTIATTHTQARYVLPEVIRRFRARYPEVRLSLQQGNPMQITEAVIRGEADLCIATEAIAQRAELIALPAYQWNRCVITPPRHPLLRERPLTLEAIARYPIVTYDFAFAGRSLVHHAFERRGLVPEVVLTAVDSDVIKTYVELGLGVGIVARMAFDPKRDRGLRAIDADHLFAPSLARIGLRRDAYLRAYVYEFIELFAPYLDRKAVDTALAAGSGADYEL